MSCGLERRLSEKLDSVSLLIEETITALENSIAKRDRQIAELRRDLIKLQQSIRSDLHVMQTTTQLLEHRIEQEEIHSREVSKL